MNAQLITTCFGRTVLDAQVQDLFAKLGTLHRPALPKDDPFVYHDWVLVRRKGVELGFADSQYQQAAPRAKWRHGKLTLVQAYFYAGFGDVRPYTGDLPYGLLFSDNRQMVRHKLAQFEASRHSYLTDTWDVQGYRLQVQYTQEQPARIDRISCRMLATPLTAPSGVVWPAVPQLVAALGETADSAGMVSLWGNYLSAYQVQQARNEGEIDFTAEYGASLHFVKEGQITPMLQAITLHRNRDNDSVGWQGGLPMNLDFEDSPETLFSKIRLIPEQQSNSAMTGHVVWQFPDHTLHVLYSNMDNRLLRVKLIAPGIWRKMDIE